MTTNKHYSETEGFKACIHCSNIKYTVTVTEDYEGNKGNPVKFESETYNSLSEAEGAYSMELSETIDMLGLTREVSLYESNQPSEDEDFDPLYNMIKSDYCQTAIVPSGSVAVYYRNHKYMGYAYDIIEVEEVTSDKHTDDFGYNADYTSSAHCALYDNIDELQAAYESNRGVPFGKVHSGSSIVEAFLSEKGVEGYNEETEE